MTCYLKKVNICPCCTCTFEKDEFWWIFDYITLVSGPAIEIVAKCKVCKGKFILSRQEQDVDLIKYAQEVLSALEVRK